MKLFNGSKLDIIFAGLIIIIILAVVNVTTGFNPFEFMSNSFLPSVIG